MKNFYSLIFMSILLHQYARSEWTEESRKIEAEQVIIWENKLDEARQKSSIFRLTELNLGLKNMGYRKTIDGHDAAVGVIYAKLQAEILSIPEHAKHFADLIENERKMVENVPFNSGPRIDYDRNRMRYLETLAHLPSPETIKVLGDYLSDERDRHELPPEEAEGDACITGGSTGNSTFSAKALEKSALRDKPYREGKIYDTEVAKAAWRSWWEEVKSGRRTFSFVGRPVEYRFKPDGTWETISMAKPPDDASHDNGPVIHAKQPQAKNPVDPSSLPRNGVAILPIWITACLIFTLIGAVYYFRRITSR